jgi:hypothetical protein
LLSITPLEGSGSQMRDGERARAGL